MSRRLPLSLLAAPLLLAGGGLFAATSGCSGPGLPEPAAAAPTVVPVTPVAAGPTCAEGTADCDADSAHTCETEVAASDEHCGACGAACGADDRCIAGACRRVRLLDVQDATACAVVDGGVQCWGDNVFQAPDKPAPPFARPARAPKIKGAVSVAVMGTAACALLRSGQVRCWRGGEVETVPGLADAVGIGHTSFKIVAARASGEMMVIEPQDEEEGPPKIEKVASVAGGVIHSCALQTSGQVTCWGGLSWLGAGPRVFDLSSDAQERMEAKGARARGLDDALQIAAGNSLTCVTRKNGRVSCWGTGDEVTGEIAFAPRDVSGIRGAAEVAVGEDHICARTTAGKVFCAGAGESGQLGAGDVEDHAAREVPGIDDAIAVGAGRDVSCAMRKKGGIACWGSASRGRLGNGTFGDYPSPVVVPGITGATAFGLGRGYSCAIDGQGALRCWGHPRAYQPAVPRGLPMRTHAAGVKFKSLDAAGAYLTAVDVNGIGHSLSPVDPAVDDRLDKLGKVKLTAHSHAIPVGVAVTAAGQVVLWGGHPGPDGRGDLRKRPVTGLTDVVSAGVSDRIVCAVRKTGKVVCAQIDEGLLDAANPLPRLFEVDGVADATALEVARSRFLVLTKSSQVIQFYDHQMMRNEKPSKGALGLVAPPLTTKGPYAIVAGLVAEQWGACILQTDGVAACWGESTDGQLGAGDYTARREPFPVSGPSDFVVLGMGERHTCGTRKGGEVLCWGLDSSDEIGQETPSFVFSPVAVLPPG